MSLDLHEIGENLIIHNGINTGLDRANIQIAPLQDATDRVDDALDVPGNSPISDLASSTIDVAASWSLVAEAADHVAETRDRLKNLVPIFDCDLAPEASGGAVSTAYDQPFGRKIQRRFGEHYGASAGDLTNPADFTEALQNELAGIPEESAKLMRNTPTGIDAFAFQMPEISYATLTYADAGGLEQPLQPVRAGDFGSITKCDDIDRSRDIGPADNFVTSLRKTMGGAEAEIPLQNLPISSGGTNLEGLDDRAVLDIAAKLVGAENSGTAFGVAAPTQGTVDENLDGSGTVNDPYTLQQALVSCIHAASEPKPAVDFADDSRAVLNAIYSDSSRASSLRVAAEALVQEDLIRQHLAGLGAIPDTFALPSKLNLETQGAAALIDHRHAIQLGTAATDSNRSIFDVGAGAPQSFNKAAGQADAGGITMGESAMLTDREAAAISAPPGWLVALTSAVVTELKNSALQGFAGTGDGQAGYPKNHFGPSGTRNDPFYVKVLDPLVTYQTHMPVRSTGSLPSQSLPFPGQVSFSP